MKKITLLIILLFATFLGNSQTSLTAGDIAFVGSNSDGATNADDTVAFVLLKDIDAATTIIFTDMGWNDGTGFFATNGDGQFTWTSGTARTAGDVVTINLGSLAPAAYSSIGDQMFAIQGSTAAPVFIAGLQYNDASGDDANWDGAATSNSTSALPNALVTGSTAVRLIPEQDNWQFSCAIAGGPVSGTAAQIRAIVNNRANWVSDNNTPYSPALEAGCGFTISGGGDTTPPVISCAPTPGPITAGTNGMAAIPDLVSGTSATDDVTSQANIVITQSPTAGTMVGVGVYAVILTATDEAGNSATCTINVTINEPPSTTLNAGDIAFVGFNLDGTDSFAFIILKDIIAGTNIKFTDCGVSNPNTITCIGGGDGSATWYASSAMNAGDIVTLPGSFMSASILSSIGDQLFAYQGTSASPNFITGIHSNVDPGGTTDADWDGANTSSTTTALPDQLTNGVNAIRLYVAGTPETESDNWQFDCSAVPGGFPITGTAIQLAAIINDIQYWTNSDTVEFVPAAKSGCSYSVLPPDTTPPVAVCMAATIQLDGTGNATLAAADVDGGSSDDSGSFTLSVSPSTFTCSEVGPNTVTLTVTDAAGNSSTCTATVTVEDNIAPVATCQVFTAQLDATGNVTISASDIDNGSTDNCGIASLSVSPASFTCANIGANTVTLTVTDANGNSSTCTSTVTVEDNVNPTATCQDATVFLDAAGNASITAADVDGGSTDNCGAVTLSVSPSSFTCADVGPNTVTLTVTDASGNSSTCTATVTVADNIVPTAVCQNITTTLDAAGNASITGADVDGGSTDNCGAVTLSVSPAVFTCSDIGPNTVTLTVTDMNGNSSTCTSTVTITDPLSACNQPPVAVCQPVTVNADGNCQGNAVASDFDGGSSDPDGDPLTFTVSPVGPYPVGVTNVILTVSDGTLSTTCNTTITVVDATPPVISCPGNITQDNDLGICGAVITYTTPVGTDNCSGASTVQTAGLPSGATFPVGTTTNTFVVTDGAGTSATCSFDVIINDTEDPTFVGTPIVDQQNLSNTNPMAQFSQTDLAQSFVPLLSTMSGASIFISATFPGTGDITIALYDNLPNAAGVLLASGTALGVSDGNWADVTWPSVPVTPGNTYYVVFTSTNGNLAIGGDALNPYPNGNVFANPGYDSFPNFDYTFKTFSGGGGSCPSDITVSNDSGICGAVVTFTSPVGTDNCSGASTAQTAGLASGSTFPIGTTTNTFVVTDAAGNTASCSFDVTVNDNENPVVVCPADITVNNDPGVCGAVVAFAPTATDNCTGTTIVSAPASGSTFSVGTTLVTVTATDASGNTTTCSFDVTVNDTEPPVANCAPPFTIQLDANGDASITVADIENGSTDACGIASTTIDITDFTCADVGPNTVTLTVTDVNGNVSTCTTIVTVEDSIPPAITCPADITVNTDLGFCSAIVNFPMPITSDNCGVATVTQTMGDPSGSMFPVGTTTIEFTAIDVNGNSNTCSFIITVVDNEAPVAVCQNITIQLDEFGNATIVAADVDGGSTDQCGVASIAIDINSFDCSDVGDNNVILTVTDVNGNTSTCTAIVTVEDVTAPVVACQNITVELDANGTVTILGTDIDNGSTDACGIASYDLDIDTFDCSNIGDNTVVLTVTDVNGNSDTCTAIVTVEDNTSPVLVCQDFTIEIGADGTATLDPSDVIASNDDACGILTVAVDITEFSCADIGTPVTVQVFSQDNNGNLSTCTATVTAVDLLAPVVTCPADQTVDPGAGNLFYILPDYFAIGEATAVDNCTDPVTITSQDPAPGTPLPDGTHTITLTATDEYGNVGTCSFELTVDTVLGAGDHNQDLGTVTLYPIPTKNILNISNPQGIELERLEVYDLRGRLVQTADLRGMGSTKPIDVHQLAAASYYVKIIGKEGQITKRLLKE